MEPRPDDGDDPSYSTEAHAFTPPQWSPALTTGTTCPMRDRAHVVATPQWSPALTTGTTASRIWPS